MKDCLLTLCISCLSIALCRCISCLSMPICCSVVCICCCICTNCCCNSRSSSYTSDATKPGWNLNIKYNCIEFHYGLFLLNRKAKFLVLSLYNYLLMNIKLLKHVIIWNNYRNKRNLHQQVDFEGTIFIYTIGYLLDTKIILNIWQIYMDKTKLKSLIV